MKISNAIIKITNLRLRTFIGFNDEERLKQQDIIINVEIHYPAADALQSDVGASALNYKTITKSLIRHVEEGRFLLLEKLVGDLLAICMEHRDVSFSRVTVDKPHALRFADSVSLTFESKR